MIQLLQSNSCVYYKVTRKTHTLTLGLAMGRIRGGVRVLAQGERGEGRGGLSQVMFCTKYQQL